MAARAESERHDGGSLAETDELLRPHRPLGGIHHVMPRPCVVRGGEVGHTLATVTRIGIIVSMEGGSQPAIREQKPQEHDPSLWKLWLGRVGVFLLLAYLTFALMFLYSGVMGHSHAPTAHPAAGHLGWILAGMSPLAAYLGFRLSGGRKRSVGRMLLALAIAAAIFVGLQVIGLMLLSYAMSGQPLHVG